MLSGTGFYLVYKDCLMDSEAVLEHLKAQLLPLKKAVLIRHAEDIHVYLRLTEKVLRLYPRPPSRTWPA